MFDVRPCYTLAVVWFDIEYLSGVFKSDIMNGSAEWKKELSYDGNNIQLEPETSTQVGRLIDNHVSAYYVLMKDRNNPHIFKQVQGDTSSQELADVLSGEAADTVQDVLFNFLWAVLAIGEDG